MNYTKYLFIFSVFFTTTNFIYNSYFHQNTTQEPSFYLLSNNTIQPFPNSKTDYEIRDLTMRIALSEIYFKKKLGRDCLLERILLNNSDLHNLIKINKMKLDEPYTQELFLIYEQTHRDYVLLTPIQKFIEGRFIIDPHALPILSHRNNPLLINVTPRENQSSTTDTNSNEFTPYKMPPQPIIGGNKK